MSQDLEEGGDGPTARAASAERDPRSRAARPTAGGLADRCVSVLIGGSTFGVPIEEVQEIIGSRPLSRVFRAPAAIAGVTSLRGDILTVIDLAELLAIPVELRAAAGPALGGASRIVVVRESVGARRRAGLRVDGLGPVRELPGGVAVLAPVPHTTAADVRPFVRGVLTEAPLCAVLDVHAIFEAPVFAALSGRPESA